MRYSALFVDDDSALLSTLKYVLDEPDLNIHFADSLTTALAWLDTLSQDDDIYCVVTDQNLGDGLGNTLLKEIAIAYPHAERIIMSGANDTALTREALDRIGLHRYIEKIGSDSIGILRNEIRSSLKRYRKGTGDAGVLDQPSRDEMEWYSRLQAERLRFFEVHLPNLPRIALTWFDPQLNNHLQISSAIRYWRSDMEIEREYRSFLLSTIKTLSELGALPSAKTLRSTLKHAASLIEWTESRAGFSITPSPSVAIPQSLSSSKHIWTLAAILAYAFFKGCARISEGIVELQAAPSGGTPA